MFLDLLFSRARRLFLKWWRRVVLMKLNVRRYEAKDACILISFAMSALTCSRRTCTSQQKSLFISSSKNKCKINHLEIYTCTQRLSKSISVAVVTGILGSNGGAVGVGVATAAVADGTVPYCFFCFRLPLVLILCWFTPPFTCNIICSSSPIL